MGTRGWLYMQIKGTEDNRIVTGRKFKVFFPRYEVTVEADSFSDAHLQAQDIVFEYGGIMESLKVKQVVICRIH